MSNLIDRQAILKYIEKTRQGLQMMDDIRRASIIMNGMNLCEKAVRNQPSAQHDAVEVIRCKDCKWYGDIGCAIRIFDDAYKPSEHDFCSFAERREDDRHDIQA